TLVETYQLPMLLTPSQNVILYEIEPEHQEAIAQILSEHGVKREDEIDSLMRYSMACPALPLCGLAQTEAERILPTVLTRLRSLLKKVGLPEEHFITRMTGCPNGCARPYLAELGFVGNGANQYQLWLGAAPNQTRLSQVYVEKMALEDLEKTLEPVLACFKKQRQKGEAFGDFCDRVGFDHLRSFAESYVPRKSGKALDLRKRVTVRDEVYLRLQQAANAKGISMADLATEIIDAYLQLHPVADMADSEATTDAAEPAVESSPIPSATPEPEAAAPESKPASEPSFGDSSFY
ncbi:MAG: hypothetical protein VKJ24_18720, partial [Synechococcales bacterium]|nr:hypothetical protein [Synechococcales bacterium]